MTYATYIHWDEHDLKIHVDLKVNKNGIVKADIYDCHGKCIDHLLEKICKEGKYKVAKKIKSMNNGIYMLKVTSEDNVCNVIRFSVN